MIWRGERLCEILRVALYVWLLIIMLLVLILFHVMWDSKFVIQRHPRIISNWTMTTARKFHFGCLFVLLSCPPLITTITTQHSLSSHPLHLPSSLLLSLTTTTNANYTKPLAHGNKNAKKNAPAESEPKSNSGQLSKKCLPPKRRMKHP